MLREEVDMIGNHHQVANLEARVHATCSVANEERLDAQLVHHTYRERHLFHRIAFIVVETALHGHDVHAAKLTKDKFAAMTFYRGNGEVGNVTVGNLQCISYF